MSDKKKELCDICKINLGVIACADNNLICCEDCVLRVKNKLLDTWRRLQDVVSEMVDAVADSGGGR